MTLLRAAIDLGRATVSRVFSGRGGASAQSSISDDAAYPTICQSAATDPHVFRNFKVEPAYNVILEHVTRTQGEAYLARVLERSPGLVALFDKFRENDRYGNPRTFEYGEHGAFSPTTLRYIKVLSDLERRFGSLDGARIVEVGVGYGGQCKIISERFRFASYTLVDIAPALALARTYLDKLGVARVEARTADELVPGATYDLVISNYAFSECTREVQELYVRRVLGASRRGYLTCNVIAPESFRSYTQAELVRALPAARAEAEDPLTYPGNYVVTFSAAS